MPYQSQLLSRITPGEIGRDQAIMNYFYYDPSTFVEEAFQLGFFDGAGKELQRYSNITLFMKSGTSPAALPRRYGCTVSDISPYNVLIPERLKVSVCFNEYTSLTINATTQVHAYISFFLKYQGLVRWTSDGTGIDNVNLGTVLSYPLEASDVVIGHRTEVSGTTVSNVFATCVASPPQSLQFIWLSAVGSPLGPALGTNCQAYVNITGVNSEYPNPP